MAQDYMEVRPGYLLDRIDAQLTRETKAAGLAHPDPKKVHAATDFVERLGALRCLARDIQLRLVSNPEMVDAPASAIASRSVALAECLLAELGKAERGEFITEEENMMNGQLFGLFRQWYYEKQAGEQATGGRSES